MDDCLRSKGVRPPSAPPPRNTSERADATVWLPDLAEDRGRDEEHAARRQAQYTRNIYAVQVAFGREIVKTPDEARGYSGRAEFAMLIPTEDGASPLYALHAGLSGWGADEETGHRNSGWGFGVPISFGYGYRTPWIIGYGGLAFGLGVDENAEPAVGVFGGFGNLGVDLMGFRVMGDARAEYRTMKYGKSRWHLTYGGLLSLNL